MGAAFRTTSKNERIERIDIKNVSPKGHHTGNSNTSVTTGAVVTPTSIC
jgi:hypothetical protein